MAIRVSTRSTFYCLIRSISKHDYPFPNPKSQTFSTNLPACPQLSQPSQHRKALALADVFQRYGFPPSQLHDFIAQNHFLLNSNSSEIEKSLKILLSLRSSQEFLISTVYNCPRVLEFDFLKDWEMGSSEMGIPKFSSLMIQNVLEVSRKFNLGPEDLSMCVQRLKGLGFGDGTVTKILEEFPMAIVMNTNGIRETIEFLVGFGINRNQIDQIFNSFPGIVLCGVQNKLKPLFDEFEYLGFSQNLVRREIIRDPTVLGLELGELSRCLDLLRTLKCRVPIKEEIYREGAFRAALKVKQRVDCICRYGLIRRDALKMLRKEPRAILYEIEDIEKKIEFLVHTMKFDVHWLVDVPEYLGVNFKKQIVPRYNVIEYLKSKGGLGNEVGLKGLMKISRLRFYNLYVKPYPECEKLFGRFAGGIAIKDQHPVGMWKLFKPKRFPESNEDLKNIKTFMESFI